MRLAILGFILCVIHPASAGTTAEATVTVQPSPDGKKPPTVDAALVGAPKTTPDKITLATTTRAGTVTVRADKLREYREGNESIAIALVVDGQEIWIGNDDIETDGSGDVAKYAGVLKHLAPAIDKLDLSATMPAGSTGMLVTYSSGAEARVGMGDLKRVTGGALGTQKDYHGKLGSDLVQGITLALSELSKVAAPRKAMIVVGDGNDTNDATAKGALAELKRQAIQQHVELFAVIYKSPISSEGTAITAMIPTAKMVSSVDGIASELDNIVARIADRYYVAFPGAALPWDGKSHELVITVDQAALESQDVTLPRWAPPQPRHFPWLTLVLVVVAIAGVVVIVVLVRRPRETPLVPVLPAPGQLLPMAMPVVAAAQPAVVLKTQMMAANADAEGFPVVGWLVPMNGTAMYRTMKLRPGMTKIGTGTGSDIVIDDGFMSTEHCQITSSPQGFTLKDSGSTNGCYVNDKRVNSQEELFDNDELMLGRTKFRFKSIN